ncbi:hypothetical protein O181_010616 [Austropuccinia psidii MF-1]|uniref:OTU domain-containing protein n=1 Tax=Austropuccinia psidii MF-1 TaxID=1389203 RepID=A0A9Q3BU50_9BASI|nr:hypothetical protein [Austropuccinia psidii MF-1]
MGVYSSEDSEDSEASLSKSISLSDSLPSATELNEDEKSDITLRSPEDWKWVARPHKESPTSLPQLPGSEDLPKCIFKYTFKAINAQGDGNCGYRTVSHYINKTQDKWADVRGYLAQEIQINQDIY